MLHNFKPWMPRIVFGLAAIAVLITALIGLPHLPEQPATKVPLEVPPSTEGYKHATATLFWIGEASTVENDFIPNDASYWDGGWMTHFGGIDDPECRNGFYPCSFIPSENPFYVALPYGERDSEADDGMTLAANARDIPWFDDAVIRGELLLKNRWVEVRANGATCYGQWQDVGPFEDDDFSYVFGDAELPKNPFGEQAGIDLSPALFTCLGFETNETVEWRFVDSAGIPDGPWKETVTTSGVYWE